MAKNKHSKQSKKRLLSLISSKVYEVDLKLIAENDYGLDVEKYYEALMRFKHSLEPINIAAWDALEVMELERWKTPSPNLEREHLRRAFCCLAILTTCIEFQTISNIYDVVFPLAESLTHIGWDYMQTFDEYLEYGVSQFETIEDIAALELARLYAAIQMKASESDIQKRLEVTLDAEVKAAKIWNVESGFNLSLSPFAGDNLVIHKSASVFIGNQISNAADSIQDELLKLNLKSLSDRVSRMSL